MTAHTCEHPLCKLNEVVSSAIQSMFADGLSRDIGAMEAMDLAHAAICAAFIAAALQAPEWARALLAQLPEAEHIEATARTLISQLPVSIEHAPQH